MQQPQNQWSRFRETFILALATIGTLFNGCATKNDPVKNDPVKLFESYLPTQPVVYERSEPSSQGGILLVRAVVPKVTYDIKRTDSLVSPLTAEVSFDMTATLEKGETLEKARQAAERAPSYHAIIELAFQHGKWKVTSFRTKQFGVKLFGTEVKSEWRDGLGGFAADMDDENKFFHAMGLPH